MTIHDNTIVTACDANYFWGALLLCLSIRRSGSRVPVHVLHPDLSREQVAMLEQIEGVRCIATSTAHAMLQKPEALLSAETAWATWIDCDIIWTGPLTPLMGADSPGIQIRIRGPEENARQFPGSGAGRANGAGAVPGPILERWRADVGERSEPRLRYMVVSNVIALHRDFRWLAERWRALMEKVSHNTARLVDKSNLHYRITDEAALTALLAFCDVDAPVLPYRLDEDPEKQIVHFEGRPKPWQGWQYRYFGYYGAVAETVAWGREQGLQMPPVPPSMLAANRGVYRWQSRLDALRKGARARIVQAARLLLP